MSKLGYFLTHAERYDYRLIGLNAGKVRPVGRPNPAKAFMPCRSCCGVERWCSTNECLEQSLRCVGAMRLFGNTF